MSLWCGSESGQWEQSEAVAAAAVHPARPTVSWQQLRDFRHSGSFRTTAMCGSHCWTRSCCFSLLGTKLKDLNYFLFNLSLIFFTVVLWWGTCTWNYLRNRGLQELMQMYSAKISIWGL